MKDIEVLGTGCAKCKRLEKNVEKALKETGVKAKLIKVEDINKIIDRGIMMSPGLVIEGKVISTGKVPSVDEIKKRLR